MRGLELPGRGWGGSPPPAAGITEEARSADAQPCPLAAPGGRATGTASAMTTSQKPAGSALLTVRGPDLSTRALQPLAQLYPRQLPQLTGSQTQLRRLLRTRLFRPASADQGRHDRNTSPFLSSGPALSCPEPGSVFEPRLSTFRPRNWLKPVLHRSLFERGDYVSTSRHGTVIFRRVRRASGGVWISLSCI